ncbi:hypothetical protein BDV34DRAFT_220606 [Aspergillus parasiticus]|uniref:Uncharacterized protein n=1 Tax=Aspergillus parasiticus TaxID=5067 RepID=A0A5N6E255_ASPPA|nr:hypothetical protein BDV34DRAFT_220606 [Aspergillus parasiticus]
MSYELREANQDLHRITPVGDQDLNTTSKWPMATKEYDPSAIQNMLGMHTNWSYDFDSAGNTSMNRTPYVSPYLLRAPDSRVYLGVYRGYYVLLGSELAAHNGWLLTRLQEMHTGLASLPSFTAPDGSKVYVGGCPHAYLAYSSSRDEQGPLDWHQYIELWGSIVYRPLSESRAFCNHGQSITDLEADTASQDGDKPLSGDEDGGEDMSISATVPEGNTKAAVIKPPSGNTAVIQDNNAEATPDTVIPLHNQVLIDEYLKVRQGAHHSKSFSHANTSLQAKVIEMAPDNNKPLMARRPSDEQVLDQVTNFLLLVEIVKL